MVQKGARPSVTGSSCACSSHCNRSISSISSAFSWSMSHWQKAAWHLWTFFPLLKKKLNNCPSTWHNHCEPNRTYEYPSCVGSYPIIISLAQVTCTHYRHHIRRVLMAVLMKHHPGLLRDSLQNHKWIRSDEPFRVTNPRHFHGKPATAQESPGRPSQIWNKQLSFLSKCCTRQ